jgi:acetate kinase
VGSYLAVLNGVDAIIFGGGVGENAAAIREKILEGMEWCGIELDQKKNRDHDPKELSCISSDASGVEVWVIPVNEAALLAQEANGVLRNSD